MKTDVSYQEHFTNSVSGYLMKTDSRYPEQFARHQQTSDEN